MATNFHANKEMPEAPLDTATVSQKEDIDRAFDEFKDALTNLVTLLATSGPRSSLTYEDVRNALIAEILEEINASRSSLETFAHDIAPAPEQ